MKQRKKIKGISLIVLVITIIIIIILAGAVILSINNSGIISKAKIATTKQEINAITEALQVYDLNNMSDTVDFTDPAVWSKREYSITSMSVELRSAIKEDIGNDFTGHKFYVLDMAKLVSQGVIPAANNGYAKKGPNDIYIIDSVTGNIYYVATPTPVGGSAVISETNPNENAVPTATQIVGMPEGEVLNSYYGTSNGTFIITDIDGGGTGGFYSLNTSSNTLECITRDFGWMINVYTFKNGMYFADGNGSLFKLTGTTLTRVTGMSSFYPMDNYMSELSNGDIYICGYGGSYRVDGTVATAITGLDPITDYTSIYENKVTGYKYITLTGGIYRLSGSVATKICEVSGAYNSGLSFDGYGNTYLTDYNTNIIYKIENNTPVEVTGWSGSLNGGIYQVNKDLYIKCMYDIYKISDKTATAINLPSGFKNDIIYDSFNDKLYITVVDSGLYYIQGTAGTKVENFVVASGGGSIYVFNNEKLGKTYIRNGSKMYLLDGLNTTQVTGMLGTTSSEPYIYFNNYNGKMYAKDYSSPNYHYYSLVGTSTTALTGFGNAYCSFYINSYNGEVFVIQNSTLYKLVGTQLTQVPGISSISSMYINPYNGNTVLVNAQGIYKFTY